MKRCSAISTGLTSRENRISDAEHTSSGKGIDFRITRDIDRPYCPVKGWTGVILLSMIKDVIILNNNLTAGTQNDR